MPTRVIAASERKRMPWKNGGGETFEIFAHPEGAGLASFDWRVSMAIVAVNGPFSPFPEIDRTICVLSGGGLILSTGQRDSVTLTPDSAPWPMSGDDATAATLIDGPVLDLNVMTRRGRFTHAIARLELRGPVELPSRQGTRIVLCSRGRVVDALTGTVLSEHDTMVTDGAAALTEHPADKGAAAFVIHIAPQD